MDSSEAKRAAEIFEASLEIPEEDLASWLERECEGNEQLLRQVKQLCSLRQDADGLFELDATAEASQTQTAGASLVGTTLGDFRIESLLGAGGMGEVYRASQLSLNRVVALKVLHPQNRSPSAIRRFQTEINAAAHLHHTNIVRVYTSGSEGNIHYFAMELVDGSTLGDVIRRLRLQSNPKSPTLSDSAETVRQTATAHSVSQTTGGLTFASEDSRVPQLELSDGDYFNWVAKHIASVADGLNYAHSQSLVHRDIKPANLLLSSQGRVLISDFGLARNISEPGITQSGEILGTPFYMSPEQLSASSALDHRTDIYSLGATLYELLTLQPPFPGESRDRVLARIASDAPIAPRRINPKIPRDLETICLKALEKSASDRFHSAGALADDLRRYLDGQPIQARRTGLVERAFKWSNRHRGLAASLVALPCCVAIVATLFAIQNYRLAVKLQAETLRANEVIFDAKVEQARALRSTDSPSRRSQSLNSLRQAYQTLSKLKLTESEAAQRVLSVRNEAIATLTIPELSVERVLPEEKPWTVEVAFSPDFRAYAQPARSGEVRIVPTGEGQAIVLAGQTNPARQMKYSPDGKFLATKHYKRGMQAEATVCVWNLEGKTNEARSPVLQLEGRWIFVSDFDFGADSQTFAAHKPGKGIEVYRLGQESTPEQVIPYESTEVILKLFADDRLAVAEHRGRELRLMDLKQPEGTTHAIEVEGRITALGWQEHPSTFLAGTSEGDVHIWSGVPSERPEILRAHDREIISVCCRTGGRLIATATLNEKVALTDLATGRSQIISNVGERLHLCSGGFSLDGSKLGFFHLGEFGFWSVSDSPVQALGTDDEPKLFTELHFHPLVERLIVRGCRGEIEFWDSNEGALLTSIPSNGALAFRFSRDGKTLFLASAEIGLSAIYVDVQTLDADGRLQVELGSPRNILKERCTQIAMSRDGRLLGVSYGSDDGYAVSVFEIASSKVIGTVSGLTRPKSIHFSNREEILLLCGYRPNRLFEVNWKTGEVLDTPSFLPDDIFDVSMSQAGDLIAIRGSEDLRLFSEQGWVKQREQVFESTPSPRVGLNNDGSLIATSFDGTTTQIIETDSGRILAVLNAYPRETIRHYEFSPSGSKLGIAGSRNMHVWDLDQLDDQLEQLELNW